MESKELPKYSSHKVVQALKIKSIEKEISGQGGAVIIPEESGYMLLSVDEEYMRKHNPQEGGYYVRYEDGYISYSPQEAFESGYLRHCTANLATIDLGKNSLEDYQMRVLEEAMELNIKKEKLNEFIHSDMFKKASIEQKDLLVRQYEVMTTYAYILAYRLSDFINN